MTPGNRASPRWVFVLTCVVACVGVCGCGGQHRDQIAEISASEFSGPGKLTAVMHPSGNGHDLPLKAAPR
jgi:hypothetical protein